MNGENTLLIWGTGAIAEEVLKHGLNGTIMGFVEIIRTKETFQGYSVYEISTDKLPDCDYIVVANAHTNTIYEWAVGME